MATRPSNWKGPKCPRRRPPWRWFSQARRSNLQGITKSRNSKIAEMEIDGGDVVISGVKTVQVEVKE